MDAATIFVRATREVKETRAADAERLRVQMRGAAEAMAPFTEGLCELLRRRLIKPTNVTYGTGLATRSTLAVFYHERPPTDAIRVTLSFGGLIAPTMRSELVVIGQVDGTIQTVLHDPTYALYGEGDLQRAMTRTGLTAEEALAVVCQTALVLGYGNE